MLELRLYIGNTGFIEFLYIWVNVRPSISVANKF